MDLSVCVCVCRGGAAGEGAGVQGLEALTEVLHHSCRLSETISLLWAAGGISQQHFPPLRREKERADRGEPARLPHTHECAFSDIIKMLELSNMLLIVLKRENCILKSRGESLLLLVLLDEAAASEASLHQHYLKMATFQTLQMIIFFFFFFEYILQKG